MWLNVAGRKTGTSASGKHSDAPRPAPTPPVTQFGEAPGEVSSEPPGQFGDLSDSGSVTSSASYVISKHDGTADDVTAQAHLGTRTPSSAFGTHTTDARTVGGPSTSSAFGTSAVSGGMDMDMRYATGTSTAMTQTDTGHQHHQQHQHHQHQQAPSRIPQLQNNVRTAAGR